MYYSFEYVLLLLECIIIGYRLRMNEHLTMKMKLQPTIDHLAEFKRNHFRCLISPVFLIL
jgi:hypothetical protein